MTFNLKIFEEVLSHLHGNYKQDIQDKRSKVSEINHLKKSWQTEIGTQVTVIPLNTNLSGYGTVDIATSTISKHIEPGIINYVPLYQIEAKREQFHI